MMIVPIHGTRIPRLNPDDSDVSIHILSGYCNATNQSTPTNRYNECIDSIFLPKPLHRTRTLTRPEVIVSKWMNVNSACDQLPFHGCFIRLLQRIPNENDFIAILCSRFCRRMGGL